jgi:ENTS family enterobactin (siderophore) exporter
MNGLFVIGGPNLGQVRAGAVAALASPPFAVVSGGLLCLLSAIAVAFWAPELPRYDRTAATQEERAAT